MSLLSRLWSKASTAPPAEQREEETETASRTPVEEPDTRVEGEQRWADEKLKAHDFGALADAAATATQETYYKQKAAKARLRTAIGDRSPGAVEATMEHLDSNFSSDLLDLLLEAGDERAVPTFKMLLSEKTPILDAYGRRGKVEEFVARFDPEVREAAERTAQTQEERLQQARDEVSGYDEEQMLATLRQLCEAYTTASSADDPDVQRLELTATAIGERLNSAGGIEEMRRVFARLEGFRGSRTLDMHWSGIGEWQG
jgi:hypothetical protein